MGNMERVDCIDLLAKYTLTILSFVLVLCIILCCGKKIFQAVQEICKRFQTSDVMSDGSKKFNGIEKENEHIYEEIREIKTEPFYHTLENN